MSAASLVERMIEVAQSAAAVITPIVGVTHTQQAQDILAMGSKIVDMIDEAKATLSSQADVDELVTMREELARRVNAHVDSTVDKLRG